MNHDELLNETMREFVEQGADIEHERWSKWQRYLHGLCKKNADGSLTIPAWQVEKAERQMNTPYTDLSEREKEADRREVRSYEQLLRSRILIHERAAWGHAVEAMKREIPTNDMMTENVNWPKARIALLTILDSLIRTETLKRGQDYLAGNSENA